MFVSYSASYDWLLMLMLMLSLSLLLVYRFPAWKYSMMINVNERGIRAVDSFCLEGIHWLKLLVSSFV